MARVMMSLGVYEFSLNTAAYQTLRRENSWRWASVPRLGGKAKQQFLGPNNETIELQGTIYPHEFGSADQVEQMEVVASTGEPQLLVDGLGFVWGYYCITRISEDRSVLFSNGLPRKIEFSLSLVEDAD